MLRISWWSRHQGLSLGKAMGGIIVVVMIFTEQYVDVMTYKLWSMSLAWVFCVQWARVTFCLCLDDKLTIINTWLCRQVFYLCIGLLSICAIKLEEFRLNLISHKREKCELCLQLWKLLVGETFCFDMVLIRAEFLLTSYWQWFLH